MVQFIPPPDPKALVPPLLACLPISFASPQQPPPALYPLLAPILRHRVRLLCDASDTWLVLLCWDPSQASDLIKAVESSDFEPHPCSGEIELSDIAPVQYKRQDEETLKAQVLLKDYGIAIHYLWCVGGLEEGEQVEGQGEDVEGEDKGQQPSWKVTEMLPMSTLPDPHAWFMSISEAEEHAKEALVTEALQAAANGKSLPSSRSFPVVSVSDTYVNDSDGENDDDYWALYDCTPGCSPAPVQKEKADGDASADDDYYSRYSTVQPALDPVEAPPEQVDGPIPISNRFFAPHLVSPPSQTSSPSPPLSQPRPTMSPTSSALSLERLEDHALSSSVAEVAIRQHISTSVKSLYRLAKGAGMSREDFADIMQRELQVLGVWADEGEEWQ